MTVGCVSEPNIDLGPPYNINALSSAESPKILVLPPKVQVTVGFEPGMIVSLLSEIGITDIDWIDGLQDKSEKDRLSKDIQSILYGYMDFFSIDYLPYNNLDNASISLAESSLLNIYTVTFNSFGRSSQFAFESVYLAPETVKELKNYTADYVLGTVGVIRHFDNSAGLLSYSGYHLVLFNTQTGRIVWRGGYGGRYTPDEFPPKINLVTDIYGFKGEMTSTAQLRGVAQNFVMEKWGVKTLAQFSTIIPSKIKAFSENHNFTHRLECSWDGKDSVGLSKFREIKGFQLNIDLDRKIARYSFSDSEMKLKVTSHQSNITLDSAFDDKFSISLNDFAGKWSGPNRVGEKTFTCSDTSAKAKLAASPRPSPPEGDSAKKDIKDTLAPLKKECESLGYKEETEQFGACVLKLLDNS